MVWGCPSPAKGPPHTHTHPPHFQVRAEILTTFALCGFANFSSIGIMLGGLSECWAPRLGAWPRHSFLGVFGAPNQAQEGSQAQWVVRSATSIALAAQKGRGASGGTQRPRVWTGGVWFPGLKHPCALAASMAPQRKGDFSQIVLRALCTGTCVSLVNACVAGECGPGRALIF